MPMAGITGAQCCRACLWHSRCAAREHRPCVLAVPNPKPQQLEGIRAACLLGRRILDAAHAAIRPGITTDEIDKVVGVLPVLHVDSSWRSASEAFGPAHGQA